jgi:hypothetical protein
MNKFAMQNFLRAQFVDEGVFLLNDPATAYV